MKIVILIPKLHAASELALNKLLQRKDLNIIGLVRSDISPLNKNYWNYIKYGVRRAGLFYGFIMGVIAYLHFIGLAIAALLTWSRKKKWLHMRKLIKKHKLKVLDTSNINSRNSRKMIESWEPDVLVSLYFDQILKKPVIDIPKLATLNMHPGPLPAYKGLWPTFWQLRNGEKFGGVTVHHLVEKIDAGAIIAQRKFRINKKDSRFSFALKSANHGAQLLIKTLTKMKQGVKLPPLKTKGKAKYYSLPTKADFEALYARGRRMIGITRLLRDFRKRL